MITVENLLMAYASAYDAWLDPETERENPTPEYAELIRRVVSAENDKLRELLRDTLTTISWCTIDCCPSDSKKRELNARACELGIELNDCECRHQAPRRRNAQGVTKHRGQVPQDARD